MNILIAAGICIGAAALEGLLAGGNLAGALRQIKQPQWALPLPAWIAIAIAYYAGCFLVLWRLLDLGFAHEEVAAAVFLLVAAMAWNASFNWFFFHQRDFRTSFWMGLPYCALILGLIALVGRVDALSALLLLIYAAYLPYAGAWSFRVWKLNAA